MKNNEWLNTWYTSPYYRLYYHLDDKKVQEDFIRRMTQIVSLNYGDRILDLGCGLGRNTAFMESLGYDVTGIDTSDAYISTALQRQSDTLHYYQHDMRSAFWVNYFDCVFNLFTSFGYFETQVDHVHLLKNVELALRDGGRLIIDFMNVDVEAAKIVPHMETIIGSVTYMVDTKIINGVLSKDFKIIDGERCFFFEEHVRAFTLEDFKNLLKESGFTIENVYGNYELADFNANTSSRLIITAYKMS